MFTESVVSVLFFQPRDIPNKAAFVSNFIEYTKVFDADPMILPITNAPPPVPRIAMKSRDGRFVCEVALDRLSFAQHDVAGKRQTLEQIYPQYRELLNRVVLAAMAGLASPVVRLGFVTRHIAELGRSANEWLREAYLRAESLPPAHETQLGFLHRFEMESFAVNRWVRIRTLREKKDPSHDWALSVEIDINTPPEAGRRFDRAAILAFFLEAFDRAERDLRSHLPDFFEPEQE